MLRATNQCYHPMVADVRPFRALRFAPSVDLTLAICPPYDIISPDEQLALHQHSPYNIVRLELPLADGDRYLRAADTLRQWLREGLLCRDDSPAFYVYDQQFEHSDQVHRRRALFAAVRLEAWKTGMVLPHERTLDAPKEDRLRLLRALSTNVSPIFALYRDSDRRLQSLVKSATRAQPFAKFEAFPGQQHTLWRLDDSDTVRQLAEGFASETLYIADGHHRYETALAYRDEVKARVAPWRGEEPENFVLMALIAADDPGVCLLPIHRLVRSQVPLEKVLATLMPVFDVEATPSLEQLLALMAQRGKVLTTIGMAAAESPDLYLLSTVDLERIAAFLPPESPSQWRNIDTAVLQYAVLRPAQGIEEAAIAAGEVVQYTEDAREALSAVRHGRFRYAFFLNPVTSAQILAVADAGHRLPQKSTYFYPKLPTGLVLNPLDEM